MHAHTQTTIDRALAKNVRIEDAHVAASNTLREVAIDFVKTYTGRNAFVQDIAVKLADYGTLSIAQMRGALNVMIAEARIARADAAKAAATVGVNAAGGVYIDLRSNGARQYDAAFGDGAAHQRETAPADDSGSTSSVRAAATVKPTIPNGYYTVIINDSGDYRTLRVTDADTDRFDRVAPGTQIVSFLAGANNESDYTGFAFLAGDTVSMWKRYARANDLSFAVMRLVKHYEDAAAEYVKRSNRCFVCGRVLTTPDSIAAGIGPICRQNVGDAFADFDFARLASAAKRTREPMNAEARAKAQADIDELFPDR